MPDEKYIQFVANYGDWVSIKKLKITEATDPVVVMEFLASLTYAVDSKVEQNLGKVVDLKKLDAAIKELALSKGQAAEALEVLNTRKLSAVINEITGLEKFQKNEKKELADFCRVYATRKVLEAISLFIDYSKVDIPALRKIKKAKE